MKKYLLILLILINCYVVLSENMNPLYMRDFDVKIPCLYNDNDCSNSVSCDLTITYPNFSILCADAEMTHNPTYFNYTISGEKLNVVGTYVGKMTCNDTHLNGSTQFYMDVTKRAIMNEDSNFVSETKILIVLISLIIMFIILGIFFSVRNADLKYLFFFMAIITIDALIYFGYYIADSVNSYFANVMFRFYYIMVILTILFVFIMLIDYTRKYLSVKKQKEIYAKDYYGDYKP